MNHKNDDNDKNATKQEPPTSSDDTPSANKKLKSSLPPELQSFDFSKRIQWGKFAPYTDQPLPLTPLGSPRTHPEWPLEFHIHATDQRARATTVHLQSPVPTPMFMPVGTKGTLKSVVFEDILDNLQPSILLANTYHLSEQPGTDLLDEIGGIHAFQGVPAESYNVLTDSGGFQMVSLCKLSQVTEEGVNFTNPYTNIPTLLRPEDSIQHQNKIGANIIMALDDVVSSVTADPHRFETATHRTFRWFGRCYGAHTNKATQNLFPIVQGGLDVSMGGLREVSLAGFQYYEQECGYEIRGYAIGGLAGGESKDDFWRTVNLCCKALPDTKPRYLMGVGYPLDLVVCTALGVDMYDCVYPTRTARFGVALVDSGTLKLKSPKVPDSVIDEICPCQACRHRLSCRELQRLFKANNPVVMQYLTQHNIHYMYRLVDRMRNAILEHRYGAFCREFLLQQFPDSKDIPSWVVDALGEAGIVVP